MNLEMLTDFFMWCTILNGAVLVLWALFFTFAPKLVQKTQAHFFPVGEDTLRVIHYCFLGGFKILFFIFCLAPYVALRIVG